MFWPRQPFTPTEFAMHVGPETVSAQQNWVLRSHCVEPHVTKPGFTGPGPMLPQTTGPASVPASVGGPPELDDVPLLLLAPLLELEVPPPLELELLPLLELEELPLELEELPLVAPFEEPVPLDELLPVVVPVPEVAPELVDVPVPPELVELPVVLLPVDPVVLPVEPPLAPEEVLVWPEVPPSDVEASALVPCVSLAPPQAAATSATGRRATRTRN
jgi:hypothetical protein